MKIKMKPNWIATACMGAGLIASTFAQGSAAGGGAAAAGSGSAGTGSTGTNGVNSSSTTGLPGTNSATGIGTSTGPTITTPGSVLTSPTTIPGSAGTTSSSLGTGTPTIPGTLTNPASSGDATLNRNPAGMPPTLPPTSTISPGTAPIGPQTSATDLPTDGAIRSSGAIGSGIVGAPTSMPSLNAPNPLSSPVTVRTAPPVARSETRTAAPSSDHVWVPGHYTYRNSQWVWVGGTWTMPPASGATWTEGRYDPQTRSWTEGHWEGTNTTSSSTSDATSTVPQP